MPEVVCAWRRGCVVACSHARVAAIRESPMFRDVLSCSRALRLAEALEARGVDARALVAAAHRPERSLVYMREPSFGGTRSKRRLRSLAAHSVSPRHVRRAREAERRERERSARERERAQQTPRAIEAVHDAVAEPYYERHADDTERAIKRRPSSAAATELEVRLASAEEDILVLKSNLDIALDTILRIPEGKDKDAAIVEFVRNYDEIELAYLKVQELGVRADAARLKLKLEHIRTVYSDTQKKKAALDARFVRVIEDATTTREDGPELRAALAYDDATTGRRSPYRKAYDASRIESTKLRAAVEAEITLKALQAERDTQVVKGALARLTELETEVRSIVRGEDFYDDSIGVIRKQIDNASELVAIIKNANPTQQQSEVANALLCKMQKCNTELAAMKSQAAGYAQQAAALAQKANQIAGETSGLRLEEVRDKALEILKIREHLPSIARDDRYQYHYIDAAIDATLSAIGRMQEKALSDIEQRLRSYVAGPGAYEQSIQSVEELERDLEMLDSAALWNDALQNARSRIQEAKLELERSLATAKADAQRAQTCAEEAQKLADRAKAHGDLDDAVALIEKQKHEVYAIPMNSRHAEGKNTIEAAQRRVDACLHEAQQQISTEQKMHASAKKSEPTQAQSTHALTVDASRNSPVQPQRLDSGAQREEDAAQAAPSSDAARTQAATAATLRPRKYIIQAKETRDVGAASAGRGDSSNAARIPAFFDSIKPGIQSQLKKTEDDNSTDDARRFKDTRDKIARDITTDVEKTQKKIDLEAESLKAAQASAVAAAADLNAKETGVISVAVKELVGVLLSPDVVTPKHLKSVKALLEPLKSAIPNYDALRASADAAVTNTGENKNSLDANSEAFLKKLPVHEKAWSIQQLLADAGTYLEKINKGANEKNLMSASRKQKDRADTHMESTMMRLAALDAHLGKQQSRLQDENLQKETQDQIAKKEQQNSMKQQLGYRLEYFLGDNADDSGWESDFGSTRRRGAMFV
jgi:hypothetical protein